MFSLVKSAPRVRKDFASCTGCGLCLLVCPVWRRTHDLALSPLGRAKALQFGALATDMADSVRSCSLCAACEPVCPEEIELVAMTLELRGRLPPAVAAQQLQAQLDELAARPPAPPAAAAALLLPDRALRAQPARLARVTALLGEIALGEDDGADIAAALEAGLPLPARRLERFLQPLRSLRKIIVADSLLLRHLHRWLPQAKIAGLGVALSGLPGVRRGLRASDLYVIDARAYHADYRRLVGYYDALRAAIACSFNLDLQRIAIPATARSLPQRLGVEAVDDSAQTRWILQGRKVARVVVENLEDAAAFAQVCDLPVVHLADLAQD
jgi:ferredoxin